MPYGQPQTWTVCVLGSSVGLLAVCDFLYIVADCGLWLVDSPCPRITLALPIFGTIRVCGIDSQWSMTMADVHIHNRNIKSSQLFNVMLKWLEDCGLSIVQGYIDGWRVRSDVDGLGVGD